MADHEQRRDVQQPDPDVDTDNRSDGGQSLIPDADAGQPEAAKYSLFPIMALVVSSTASQGRLVAMRGALPTCASFGCAWAVEVPGFRYRG